MLASVSKINNQSITNHRPLWNSCCTGRQKCTVAWWLCKVCKICAMSCLVASQYQVKCAMSQGLCNVCKKSAVSWFLCNASNKVLWKCYVVLVVQSQQNLQTGEKWSMPKVHIVIMYCCCTKFARSAKMCYFMLVVQCQQKCASLEWSRIYKVVRNYGCLKCLVIIYYCWCSTVNMW